MEILFVYCLLEIFFSPGSGSGDGEGEREGELFGPSACLFPLARINKKRLI